MNRLFAFVLVWQASLYGQHRMYWQEACFKNPRAAYCRERDWVPRPAPKEPAPAKSVITNRASPYVQRTARPSVVMVGAPMIVDLTGPPSAKPIAKLDDDKIASIGVGSGRQEVLEKLGEPSIKISGDFERYTYLLQSGGTLKLDFEEGRVTQIRK